jgi:small-conductance mechanosensitive channel
MDTLNSGMERWLADPALRRLVLPALILLALFFLVRILRQAASRYVKDGTARYRMRKFIGLAGYLAAGLTLAIVFSDKLGGLTIAFGVAGAGVAFALQEVIASVAGWLAITAGGFFKIGDRIQLGGIVGDVIDIGVIRTTLFECGQWVRSDQYSGRVVRVANSFVFKEPVFNYSGDFPFLWDEIVVPVKHGGDVSQAREILNRVGEEVLGAYARSATQAWDQLVKKFPIESARIEPSVTLIANDNWIEFTLRYVVDYKRRRSTKDELFTKILEEFKKTNRQVEFASSTFQLVGAPTLHVKLKGDAAASQ